MKKTSTFQIVETFTVIIIALIALIVWVDRLDQKGTVEAQTVSYTIEQTQEVVKEAVPVPAPSVTELSVVETHKEAPKYLIDVTETEIQMMIRVVMSEASILNIDAMQAVASTIVNRVKSDLFPDSVYEILTQDNQYSMQDNGEPTKECELAVYAALQYECFPADMYYFRSGRYHDFGTEYIQIDGMYFSRQ